MTKPTKSETQTAALSVLKETLRRCAERRLSVGLLRPKPLSPSEAAHGDFDLFCAPPVLRYLIATFCSIAREQTVTLYLEHTRPAKWVLRLSASPGSVRIVVEIWTRIELTLAAGNSCKPAFLRIAELEPHIQYSSESASLKPVAAALVYVTHLYHKNKDLEHPEVRARLKWYRNELSRDLSPIDGDRLGVQPAEVLELLSVLGTGNPISELSGRASVLLRKHGVRPRAQLLFTLRKKLWRRHQERPRRSHHPIVAIVGPDGTGKTTVLQMVADRCPDLDVEITRFKKLFRNYPLLAKFTKSRARGETRNVVEERLSTWISALAVLRLRVARVVRRTPALWLLDRYFYDYYYRGLRDHNMPRHRKTLFARVMGGMVPRPAALIVCHCPEQQRLERKPHELTSESAALLYATYVAQVSPSRVNKLLFLSTAGTLEDTGIRTALICDLLHELKPKHRQRVAS